MTEHLAADVAQQHAQEAHDARRIEGVLLHLQAQPPIERDPTDHQEVIIRERRVQVSASARAAPGRQ